MKIAVVSTHDVLGGAALAAFRLCQGLRDANLDSRMVVRFKSSHDEHVIDLARHQVPGYRTLIDGYSFLLRSPILKYRRPKNSSLFSLCNGPLRHLGRFVDQADVINLHWTTSMIDLGSLLNSTAGTKPLVWTLHDMNLMTGGCHHAMDCDKYLTECDRCPQLGSSRTRDLSWKNFNRKDHLLRSVGSSRLVLVAPSQWLANRARRSHLLKRFRIETIPNGIDLEVFRPRECRTEVREKLGIGEHEKVVAFVANSVTDYLKGFDLLQQAFCMLAKPIVLLVMGKYDEHAQLSENVRQIPLGFVSDDQSKVDAYSAADLFVIPSREENLPNTIMESLACGTPVVGFGVGGIPEMIIDGETGGVADKLSPDSLAAKVESCLALPLDSQMSMRIQCRDTAVAGYDASLQVRRYKDLFSSLIETSKQ